MNGVHMAASGSVSFPAELKYTQAGKAMLTFNMRADQSYSASESKPSPEPIYLRVVCWEDTAATLADLHGQIDKERPARE